MKNINVSSLVLAGVLLSSVVSAYEVEFNQTTWCTKTNGLVSGTYNYVNKIPEGCAYTNSNSNLRIDGTATPGEGIYALKYILSVQANSVGDLMMGTDFCIPRSEIVCDNIIGSLMLYVYPTYKAVDTFQLIATTNDWKNILPIGNPIPIRDDSYAESGWMSLPVDDVLPGISAIAKSQDDFALRIGVRAKAGGISTTQGYLHRISVDFKARATPGKPFLVDCQTNELNEVIDPGKEYGRMAVKVNVSPEDKICNLVVTGILSRCNGERTVAVTNELEKIDGIYYEKMDDVTNRVPFDAGEVVTCSVFTKYQTTDPAISPLSESGEFSEVVQYDVGKRGSVWINEIGIVNGKCFVELCGTTNRSYLSDWQVILSGNDKAYTNNLSTVFDFATNMVNGVVGIETYRWTDLDSGECKNAMLELRNSAGVVEFAATDVSIPGHCQMTGKAKWQGKTDDDWSYDWTGTATDGPFTFGSSAEPESFGHVNGGQGFLIPVRTKLYFTTLIEGNGDPLPYASISATVDGILNGKEGTTNFVGQTDEAAGTAEIGICGYSDDASYVLMTNSISAFAWKSDNIVTNVSLYSNIYLTNNVKPDVAYDDFSELKDYWRNESAITVGAKTYYWGIENGLLQLESFNGQAGKNATLTSKSYMALRGKRHLDISLDIWNTKVGVAANRIMITVDFADTPDFKGNVFETVGLANKNQEYKDGEKYTFRECVELPQGFAREGRVWIRVRALKEGASSSGVAKIDNLRIAAQDSVKINEFKMDEPSGSRFPLEVPLSVELDISPLTGGIVSNFVEEVLTSVETNYVRKVAADLVLTINGTEFAVPFSFADGSLTNDISAAEENVKMTIAPSTITKMTGGFLPGDEVQYYVRVTYDPDDADDNGERDERYYPDNATATANGWRVENGYLPVANSFTVTGPALSVYGTPEITADRITVNYNAWDADGIASLGFEVTSNGVPVQTESLSTNGVGRVMGIFAATNLVANTEYVLSLSGTRTGGGDLTPTNYTFVTLPLLTSAKIVGTLTTEAKLTVSGQAAGYVVTPDAWKADSDSATTWTWVGGSPDSEYKATVYATNKVGVASVATNTVSGYTLAAVAKGMPTIEKVVNEVKVWAPDGYVATQDGNQSDTEYTVRVVTSSGKTNDVNKWQTLADWANPVMVGHPDIDLEATNNFWFITRNHDGIVTGNDNKDATTNCWFELVADITNVVQKADPFGTVDIALKFFDPAKKEATATVKYSFDGTSWTDVCDPFEVHFSDFTAGAILTWNAREAVENTFAEADWNLKHPYSLKVQLTAGSRTSEWMVKDGCEVDFEKPIVAEFSSNVPDAFNWSPMKVTVKFSKPVVDFTADKVEVGNGTAGEPVSGQEDNTYTIDVMPAGQGVVTVRIATVKDKFGNGSEPTPPLKKTYDTGAPEWDAKPITGTPAKGSATNGTWYALTAHAKDKDNLTPITYHWSFDEKTWTDGQKFTGNVTGEKEYTVYVFVTDAAGNVSTTNTWSWTYDKTAPVWDTPAITGTPANGSYTNGAHYALTAYATDNLPKEVPIFYWSFDKQTWTAGQTFEDDVVDEKEYTLYVYATDRAGNVAPTNEWSWTYDKTAPTAAIADPADGLAKTNNLGSIEGFRLTLNDANFKEPALTSDSFELVNCTIENLVAVDDAKKDWTFTVKPMGDGEVTVQLRQGAFVDLAGNPSEASNLFWFFSDRTAPKVNVDCTVVLTNDYPIAFKVTVEDLTLRDETSYLSFENKDAQFTVENGSIAGVEGTGTNYVVTVAPNDDGDVKLTVRAGAFKDEAGNDNIESNTRTVAYDHTAPEVWVSCNVAVTNASPIEFKVTLTETHLDPTKKYLTAADQFTAVNGEDISVTGQGAVYTVMVTPKADGEVTLKVNAGAFKDEAGNDNAESYPAAKVISDRTEPTAKVECTTSLTNGLPIEFKVTLSDSQTNLVTTGKQYFTLATAVNQFTVGAGCTITEVSGEGTNYVVKVTRTGEDDGVVSLLVNAGAFKDDAGNENTASDPAVVTYDGTLPTVKVSCAVSVTNASPIVFAVKVTDNHLTLGTSYLNDASQFTVENGDVASVDGQGADYNVAVTPHADGKVTLKVNAGAFKDDAGNENTASTPAAEVVSDRTDPTAKVECTASLTNGLPIAFKVTLSDSQTNLVTVGKQYFTLATAANQFTVGAGCTITEVSGEGTNYVVKVTRTGEDDGVVSLQVNAGAFKDDAGNGNVVSNEGKAEYDHTAPKVKIAPNGVGEVTDKESIPFKVTVTDAHRVTTALEQGDFYITTTDESGTPVAPQDPPEISDFANDGNTNYTFNVSSPEMARELPIVITLTMTKQVTDEAGNVTEWAEGRVISDRTMPVVTIATAAISTNNAASISYTMTVASFSSVTNNLTGADIAVPAGCQVTYFSGTDPNDAGAFTNYTFNVTTPASGDTLMVVELPEKKVFNRAGTGNDKPAAANTVISDHTPPVPVVTCTASSLTNNLEKIPFKITVVETNGLDGVLNTLKADSVEVVSGDAEIKDFGGSGLNYSFNVVPNNDDVGEIKVGVKAKVIADFAGNTNVASEVVSVVSDCTRPTAELSTAIDLTRARNEETIAFTVTLADSQDHLSAESNYLSIASFVPGKYTVDSVTGKGKTYTATIRPTEDGPVSVGISENAFSDLAGNGNTASVVTNFVSDRTAPTITFDGQNINGRHFEMTVSATDTPETTKDIEYKWSVVGSSGQSFGDDWAMTETNKDVVLRGTGLDDGAWSWTVQFRDVAGNIATTNGNWSVRTDEAPELELTPSSGTVNGSADKPLVFTLKANGDLKLTKALNPDMVQHVSRDQVFYRQVVAITSDSLATITLTPVKQDRDFTDEVTLTVPCGAATGTNGIAAATLNGKVTYKFSGTNTNPETVRVIRLTDGYQDDPRRTNENLGEITLLAKTLNGAKFAQGFTQESITGASVKSAVVAADGLSVTITLTADAWTQLVDVDGWKGFNLVFAGGSVESLPSPISAGSPVAASVKVWRNLARVAGENGAAIKVDEADAPLAHDGDARTVPPEGSTKLAATFPRARVNAVHIRLSAASAKEAYKPTQATVTLKSAGKALETFVTDLVWDGKRCAPVDLLVTPQDMLVGEAIADEAELSFTGSTAALYLNEFAVFGIPEAVDPLYPEVLSVNPVEGGFVVQTDMGVSNWVKAASQALELESAGVTTGVAIDWAKINWADATRTALKVPVSGQAAAGYVGGATLRVKEGFLQNFVGRGNVGETISASTLAWNSETVPMALSFKRYKPEGETVKFGTDALQWTLVFNQPVLNLSADSFTKHNALGIIQVLGTASPTNYIVRAQLNCWTNEVTGVKMTLKAGAVKGLTGKDNAAVKESETYKLEKIVPVQIKR